MGKEATDLSVRPLTNHFCNGMAATGVLRLAVLKRAVRYVAGHREGAEFPRVAEDVDLLAHDGCVGRFRLGIACGSLRFQRG
jgi:hypothetical protein